MTDKPKDWRIGLSARPKFRGHELYYESAKIIDVFPSGHGNISDRDGVLKLELGSGRVLLVPAGDWMTA